MFATPAITPAPLRLQRCGGRACAPGTCNHARGGDDWLRRQETTAAAPGRVPPSVAPVLAAPGRPLDAQARQVMERSFGHDFAHVRIHDDGAAHISAHDVDATAYTVGNHVVMGSAATDRARSGYRVLAHELTHVIQQSGSGGGSGVTNTAALGISSPSDPSEVEARQAADAVVSGHDLPAPASRDRQVSRDAAQPTGAGGGSTARMQTVKVWLNAFIPRDVPGKTEPAPGPHAGETMVRGPLLVPFTSSLALPIPPALQIFPLPQLTGSSCFITDNRGFSSNIHASSRMHSEIEITDLGTLPRETFHWHFCYESIEVDCDDGAEKCAKYGDPRMQFSNLRGAATAIRYSDGEPGAGVVLDPNPNVVQVDYEGAANVPCVVGSPDIDMEGTIKVDPVARTVSFDGAIDQFPAFEMYAAADNGAPVEVFTIMPEPGKDPWDLPGLANRPVVRGPVSL